MSRKLTTLCACLMLTVTSACATGLTAPVTRVTSDACLWVKPISYDSNRDAPETVEQIEAHNSAWVCNCDDDCPKG